MKRITVSMLSILLMLSMVFSSSVFAADEQSAWESFLGLFTKAETTELKADLGVEYRGHVQNKGDYPLDDSWVQGPEELGTTGEGLRLEGFWLNLTGEVPDGLNLTYRVHVQNVGWMDWEMGPNFAGTEGRGLQIESLEIKLVDAEGNLSEDYSVHYTGHVQNQGDVPANDPNARLGQTYYADGEQLGTDGLFLRLEAISVEIVEKEADLSEYSALVNMIESLDEDDYTAESWATLMQVMEDYAVTTADYQADVDLAVEMITLAVDQLVDVNALDFTEYDDLVTAVQDLDRSLYTEDSLVALDAAVDANPVESLTTQEEIDAAVVEIQAAFDALVEMLSVKSVSAINASGVETALDGAVVARNSTYEMTFTGEFDPATVTSTTIKLAKGTETMAISQPTINNGVVTFKSLSTLVAGAEYTLTVDGVKSADGLETISNVKVATFTAADTVVTKKVTANSTKVYDSTTTEGVSLNVTANWSYGAGGSSIIAEFDTPVDKSTINSSTIQLIDLSTGKNLAVEGNQYLTSDLEIKVVGSGDYLIPKHQYKLVLDGLKAANGKTIDTFAVTFAYKAGAPIGVDAADVYNGDLKLIANNTVDGLVNPLTTSKMLDNGTTFKAEAALVVDFGAANVKLDPTTVTTDYLYIRDKATKEKVAQAISYNSDMNRVVLTPSENLKDDTTYEIYQSPYMKNVFGITLGSKDSDYKTRDFKTLDVTAPTVVGQPESTLESKALTNLPLTNGVFKIRVKISEKIDTVNYINSTSTSAYSDFATAAINGNILVTRADDEKITAEAALAGLVSAQKVIIGTDQFIELIINPADVAAVKGKTFRVTLAGTNPSRANNVNKVITDAYALAPNAMANDYSFTFSFEGEDKTAPKVTAVNGSYNGTDLETASIEGMTNVNEGRMRIAFDSSDVNPFTISNIKLVDKNNAEYRASLLGSIVVTGNTSYADVAFAAAADGPATLKIQDVADNAGNKSTLQSYNLTLGNGPRVTSAKFVTTSSDIADPTEAGESIVRIDYLGDLDTTTLAGNVKLLNGTTEVATTVDASKAGYLRVLPAAPLAAGTKYTVVVSKNVKNTDGNMLQQVATAAPADFSVNLTTLSSDAAKLVSAVVNETTRTITLTFDKNIGTVDADVVLKNFSGGDVTITNDSATDKKFIKIEDNIVTITVYEQLLANVDYQGSIAVTDTNGIGASANFSAQTTKEWKLDPNKTRPEVQRLTAAGGVFTFTFTEEVKIADVKSAVKVYNATDATDVKMFASSFVPSGGTHTDYATTYVVTIPGYDAAKDYVVSFAKETIHDYAGFTNADAYDKSLATADREVDVVIAEIANLPAAADITLADEAAVVAARASYDALTPAQQALVTNYADLVAVEAALEEAKNQAVADPVIAEIGALPAAADITLADEAAVVAARASYDALTPAQKALVPNVIGLTAAEAKIAELKGDKTASVEQVGAAFLGIRSYKVTLVGADIADVKEVHMTTTTAPSALVTTEIVDGSIRFNSGSGPVTAVKIVLNDDTEINATIN